MDDLFKSLESLSPILIFVIWIMASLARKKKKTPQRQPVPQHPADQLSHSSTRQQEKRKPGLIEELKKSLETIFVEMGSVPDSIPQSQKYPEEVQSLEAVELEEASIKKTQQRRLDNKEISDRETAKIYGLQANEDSTEFDISQDELRKAMIWSEVLSTPVSLR